MIELIIGALFLAAVVLVALSVMYERSATQPGEDDELAARERLGYPTRHRR